MTTLNPSATWTLEELQDRHVRHALHHLSQTLKAAQNHAVQIVLKDGDAYCPACGEYIYRSTQLGAVHVAQEMYQASTDDGGAMSYDTEDPMPMTITDAPIMVHFPSGNRPPHMIRPAEGMGEVLAW